MCCEAFQEDFLLCFLKDLALNHENFQIQGCRARESQVLRQHVFVSSSNRGVQAVSHTGAPLHSWAQ